MYITPKTILNRITRIHKHKQLDIKDVIEWSAECEIEVIEDFDYFVKYYNIPLKVEKQNRVYYPCLLYRILDVKTKGGRRIPFSYDHQCIVLQANHDEVLIDYLGIPISEKGEILVDVNHAQAVVTFIVEKLYYEDYITGKIHPNVYQDIMLKLENELLAAKGSYRKWDQSRFETLSAIRNNMIPEIARVPFYQYYSTSNYDHRK
jgi:hypothetical protein